jgi:transglutaminase-like putative cysteine protease
MLATNVQHLQAQIAPGEAGIFQSVAVIKALIRKEASDPIVRSAVSRIVAGIAPGDNTGRLSRILSWVRANLSYLPDPREVEAVGTPVFHLNNIRVTGSSSGDCDDSAALVGALARSVGRKVRLHIASFRADRRLHHIWAEAQGDRGWVQLDPFRSERFGRKPTRSVLVTV